MAEVIQNNQPIMNPQPPSKQPLPIRTLATFLVIALIFIGIGAYWITHKNSNQKTTGNSYTYQKATDYFLTGKGKGYGMIVSRPDPINHHLTLKAASPKIVDPPSYFYTQLLGKTGNIGTDTSLAYFGVKTTPYPNPVLGTTTYKDLKSKIIEDAAAPNHSNSLLNIQKFAGQLLQYGQYVSLSSPKSFVNDNVKKYAWQFDLTTATHRSTDTEQQGKAIYILGNHGWYYFMVSAEKNNWQNNQTFFQKVLKSIRVDQ